MIERLFPAGVVTVEATEEMWDGDLYPEERDAIRSAIPKRRREYTAGRLCARRALSRLGIERFPLLSGPGRVPLWPPGVTGSLSHCANYCAVAVTRRGAIQSLGFDAESCTGIEPATARRICTPAELSRAASRLSLDEKVVAKVLFSIKESLYKCVFPLTGVFLGFLDVDVRLDGGPSVFVATILKDEGAPPGTREISGRFLYDENLILSGTIL